MKKSIALPSLLVLTCLMGCATPVPKHPQSRPAEAGETSFDDFNKMVCGIYQILDKDQDGTLDSAEYVQPPGWLGEVKRMPNGHISIVDFVAAADRKFSDFSHTHANVLTREEMNALEKSKP